MENEHYKIEPVKGKKINELSNEEYLLRFGYSRKDFARICRKQIKDDEIYRRDSHNCPVFAGHF